MEEVRAGKSEKQAASKKLARSGSSRPAPVRERGHGRRWSSSTDLDIEAAAAAAAAVLGRSYSAAAAVTVVDGGVKQKAAREGGEGEVEQRPRRRCGASARLSQKIKEHRTRFYIMRRCVAMLICWRDVDD